jgi:hypothetical protein
LVGCRTHPGAVVTRSHPPPKQRGDGREVVPASIDIPRVVCAKGGLTSHPAQSHIATTTRRSAHQGGQVIRLLEFCHA